MKQSTQRLFLSVENASFLECLHTSPCVCTQKDCGYFFNIEGTAMHPLKEHSALGRILEDPELWNSAWQCSMTQQAALKPGQASFLDFEKQPGRVHLQCLKLSDKTSSEKKKTLLQRICQAATQEDVKPKSPVPHAVRFDFATFFISIKGGEISCLLLEIQSQKACSMPSFPQHLVFPLRVLLEVLHVLVHEVCRMLTYQLSLCPDHCPDSNLWIL